MSKYTTEVRFICETAAGYKESQGYSKVDSIIEKALPTVFDFDFPIFDESYRTVLETKILRHYYTREICEETVGLWKLRLESRLNEIMPYYNKLYNSELLEFNPLYDYDLTTQNSGSKNESNTRNTDNSSTYNTTQSTTENTDDDIQQNGTSQNTNYSLYSDTPQGALTGVDSETYLTDARKTTDNGSTTDTTDRNTERTLNDTKNSTGTNNTDSTFTGTTTDSYVTHVTGKLGGKSYSKMIEEFRATLLNIDMDIINDLSDLFFNLW